MPNRILRDWTDSEKIDKLTLLAEVFFTRLMMKADDYGYYHANPKLLKSALFPLRDLRETDMARVLAECKEADLIALYEVKGAKYLQIKNFGQRLRTMKSLFPPPDSSPPSNVSNSPPEEKGNETKRNEVELEGERKVLLDKNCKDLRESSRLLESVCVLNKITKEKCKELLETFITKITGTDEIYRPLTENKRHFTNWVPEYLKNPMLEKALSQSSPRKMVTGKAE